MLTRVKAEASAPTLDAVVWDDPVAVQARDAGLVEMIDAANIPNMKDLAAWADYKDGFGPSIHSNPSMWAYNTDNFKLDPPQSYKDIWSATYQKALDLPSVDVTQGIQFLVLAAMLFGGGYDNIEPGFTAMQQLQPNVGAYYHDVSEIAPTLQNDPYIMLTGNGQIHNVLGQGYPLKIVVPAEGALATPVVFDIIKGSKAKPLLEQLLNSYLDPANQLEIAKAQYWAVPNTKVVIPDEYQERHSAESDHVRSAQDRRASAGVGDPREARIRRLSAERAQARQTDRPLGDHQDRDRGNQQHRGNRGYRRIELESEIGENPHRERHGVAVDQEYRQIEVVK